MTVNKKLFLKLFELSAELYSDYNELLDNVNCNHDCKNCDINWNRFEHKGIHPSYFCTQDGSWRNYLTEDLEELEKLIKTIKNQYDIL